jgi:hypothetical protein
LFKLSPLRCKSTLFEPVGSFILQNSVAILQYKDLPEPKIADFCLQKQNLNKLQSLHQDFSKKQNTMACSICQGYPAAVSIFSLSSYRNTSIT